MGEGQTCIVTNINGSNDIIQNGLSIKSQNEYELYEAMEKFILDNNL